MFEYLSNGGKRYTMFSGYEITREVLDFDPNVLSDFIKNNLNGEIPK